MANCINHNCGIVGHSHVPSTSKPLFIKIPQFYGLSWFEIAHHELLTGLSTAMLSNFAVVNNQKCPHAWQQKSTKTSHNVCNMIWGMYTEDDSKQNYDSHAENINE